MLITVPAYVRQIDKVVLSKRQWCKVVRDTSVGLRQAVSGKGHIFLRQETVTVQ